METLAKKYKGKAEFVFVYCREQHPLGSGNDELYRTKQNQPIPQAKTMDDRKKMAQLFCDDMKSSRLILVDEFDEKSVQRRFRAMSDSTIIVDINGKIALKMAWTNGQPLGDFLPEFVARGGKLDWQLAALVPYWGMQPYGPRKDAPRTRGGDRRFEGINLNASEMKDVQAMLQAKSELRGRVMQKAMELDKLARSTMSTEAELAGATKAFEAEIAEYRTQASKLDRGLEIRLSTRARAQLLAAGILENGIGFLSADMRRTGQEKNAN